ncbi:GH92 family glycosyl hydrolase [Dysgonomonas sp. Marseille-P4677]|uniref:GH92 family glycosyl hydrolase n=1 Tax=Dysgonomonas sp. Marseille-P4677 TaxID=2364790 RepID=UPI0019146BCA|nr:GH92 family glycosyl hydrolase [Dysgonomonas sp. Marseille-P4677]MBK5720890.1 GH92 family glycosyl hydrolase [Dysgonomonas sp. Marseille-P4677]
MKNFNLIILFCLSALFVDCSTTKQERLTDYVNPFIGTTTLWDSIDLGYTPTRRAWGAEAYPGASVPNSMVQVTPVTMWRSGSGYQYEDSVIYAFTHTSKGHWNLCYVPLIAASGDISPKNYYSPYSHGNESASPGYYQVFLEKYNINAEVTSTLRCAYHKYTYKDGKNKKIIADLARSNEHVRDWEIGQSGDNIFTGFQKTGSTFYFYAVTNHKIKGIESLKEGETEVSVVNFVDDEDVNIPLEMKIGFSYVSIENAKENLESEMLSKDFLQVRNEATNSWEDLLSKIQISGGTEDQKETFYSTFYRAFLWPILLSDINGEFIDANGEIANKGFRYYSDPSFWDDYRNKLILLGMISPDVATDVIKSITDRGEIKGFMPTFFHGDHASTFIAGSYLRGLQNFDIQKAYKLLLNNAFVEGKGGRPHIKEYIERGWISEEDIKEPKLETVAKAAVTKTQEYSYDDYATALLAKELGDQKNYEKLMMRTNSYKHLFDPSTQLMRGRLNNGEWITPFDPERPFYEYMYREANGWQSTFFAPHDPEGFIALYPSKDAFENKLDSLFSIPWKNYEAHNMTVFIGQYCHGNQPGHSSPYLYYFIDKQEKAQKILNKILNEFYRMGPERLAYAGMDDAGEMSSWYVLNAIGLYTYSPADPEYIITVPLFDKVVFNLGENKFTIIKKGKGEKIEKVIYGDKSINNYFITHDELKQGKELVITTSK